MNERIGPINTIYMGCDPELFFEQGGEIIGAEKVLGKEERILGHGLDSSTKLVLDGVQAEINLPAMTCRQSLANYIARVIYSTAEKLKGSDIKICYRGVVDVTQKELDTLSDKSKVFGCAPSLNLYEPGVTPGVDPKVYLKRSAGGHIHLGFDHWAPVYKARTRLVPILDVLLGNTCVLIDRDPANAERRKVYGRAGEYRLPKHGLEYRTLSNFWLRSYELTSLVFGLARTAVNILGTTVQGQYAYDYSKSRTNYTPWPAEERLLNSVNLKQVVEAINTNNVDLAKENYRGVRDFLEKYVHTEIGLYAGNLDLFDHFIARIDEKGLDYWFPNDPTEVWCRKIELVGSGWETFLQQTVCKDAGRG